MGVYTLQQISSIIVKNPNKKRLDQARKLNSKMMLHLHGEGMKNAIAQLQYFENSDIYKARKDYATSNVDLFERLLQEESQIFSARGGSSYFNLADADEKKMNTYLSDVIYGLSLRKWVSNFGLNAYRADPMGVIFMEVDKATYIDGNDDAEIDAPQIQQQPKCYPVYKSVQDIWDYQSNGRKLDYICFALTADELEMYGIQEKSIVVYSDASKDPTPINKQYFRFVDDVQDVILKLEMTNGISGDSSQPIVSIVPLANGFINPIVRLWDRVPGFIISDIIKFSDPGTFDTPLCKVVELADNFLMDRSVKNLQQKYHGFAKAVEPLVRCLYCNGEGYVKGCACPECTVPGQSKGSGFKLQTKISDALKIPMEILNADKAPRFDIKKIYTYITPDIESWNKQDESLESLANRIYRTYWGTSDTQISGFNGNQDQEETATKTITNLQPKYARLNATADWAEQTERTIADFIGSYYFKETYKSANITYGRNYILESPETILEEYYEMKANGVADSMLDNQYEKYIKCLYQSNHVQQLIYQKKFDVEPFPHLSALEVELSTSTLDIDKVKKRYYGEWDDTITDPQWTLMTMEQLRQNLTDYATKKQAALLIDKANAVKLSESIVA